ncbi:MAG: hypothetical protein CSA11_04325 [Chloroflexi bacterium]|nr:MAG: hypothetical protein CSB13_11325 [Chloroflexota bacterium]PIE81568.1 MAG: hypothetical protein CSA11_04325 [Chloroflexota bacterium]
MVWGILLVVPKQRVGVEVVLFNDQRQVLLLNHVFHPEMPWGIPGGWLDKNEDPAHGALRELREETGLTAVLGPILLLRKENSPPHIGIAYLALEPKGDFNLSSEIIEATWGNLDELPQLQPFTQEAIEKAVVLYDSLPDTALKL